MRLLQSLTVEVWIAEHAWNNYVCYPASVKPQGNTPHQRLLLRRLKVNEMGVMFRKAQCYQSESISPDFKSKSDDILYFSY